MVAPAVCSSNLCWIGIQLCRQCKVCTRVQPWHKAFARLPPVENSIACFLCSGAASGCKEVKNNTKVSTFHISAPPVVQICCRSNFFFFFKKKGCYSLFCLEQTDFCVDGKSTKSSMLVLWKRHLFGLEIMFGEPLYYSRLTHPKYLSGRFQTNLCSLFVPIIK